MSARELQLSVIQGDCIEAMAAMPAASVDAIVTDPPYGLEFMGKDWDRLDGGLPQENVWKGRRGKGGSSIGTDDSKPAARHHVALGAGKKQAFKRCLTCGKRAFSGSPCECETPDWTIEYPDGAPSSSIRMQRWHETWSREALRVLKPGGHLLAFGGTRTYHRLACAIEDAGFEIRDTIAWLYGSGFPKSLDVSKAIDKAAGAEREVVGTYTARGFSEVSPTEDGRNQWAAGEVVDKPGARTVAATTAAERWSGWGTALKPAHEPIVVARKPLTGTVTANVLAHGTGALNVDGCRIASAEALVRPPIARHDNTAYGAGLGVGTQHEPAGRWPANVCLDEQAAALLDEQTGTLQSGSRAEGVPTGLGYHGANGDGGPAINGDSGGASRFLYIAKASSAERNAGLDGFEEQGVHPPSGDGRVWDIPGSKSTHRRNHHPTVKPIALMRWLVRLVTPPGGTVLDPFAGSGTTGIAAVLEGFKFVGIEREAEYVAIAQARIAWWARHPDGMTLVKRLEAEAEQAATAAAGQASLFDIGGAV